MSSFSEPSASSSDPVQSSILTRSALLSTFPWFTDFLTNTNGDLKENDMYKALFSAITDFESSVATMDGNARDDTWRALALVDNDQLPKNIILNRPTSSKAIQVVSIYRLVDILHALHGRVALSGGNPRYSKLPLGQPSDQRSWPIHNWVTTLKTAMASIGELTGMAEDIDPSEPLQTRLVRDLCRISSQNDGTKILFNVQMAAIGVNFMLQGSTIAGVPGCFPLNMALPELSPTYIGFLEELMKNYDAGKRRYPLSLALLVSPLCLLSTKKLLSRSMAQETLLKTSKILGNCKPPIVLSIELKLWEAVLAIATGKKTTATAISDFLNLDVPWSALNAVSDEDQNFFMPNSLQGPSLKNFQLLTLANESEVGPHWPLAHLRPGFIPVTSLQLMNVNPSQQSNPGDSETGALGQDDSQVPGILPEVDSTNAMNLDLQSNPRDSENADLGENDSQVPSIVADPHSTSDMNVDEDHSTQKRQESSDSEESDSEDSSSSKEPTERDGEHSIDPDGEHSTEPDEDLSSHEEGYVSRRIKVIAPRRRVIDRPRPVSAVPSTKAQSKSLKGKQRAQESRTRESNNEHGYGSCLNPIKIEDMMAEKDVTFELRDAGVRCLGSNVRLFGPCGAPTEWAPSFHFKSDTTSFNRFVNFVEHSYVDDQPRHISCPEKSHIAVLDFPSYDVMSVSEVQALLRKKHILIQGCPHAAISFDAKGLQNLANLDEPIDIQDQSMEVFDGDYARQVSTGTLRQMLEASRTTNGPILNALSFPLPLSGVFPSGISSEIEAWRATAGKRFCPSNLPFPVGSMRWGLAAMAGARHWIHIDSDGLGTFVDVQCGGKWWIVFSPPDGEVNAFSGVDVFLNKFDTNAVAGGKFDLSGDGEAPSRWVAEAVYLTAGTRLIMKPNTPHAVFTTDHCISFGGHFYASSNIQNTFFGIVHCLMGNNLLTNTYHFPSRQLLMRMMQYYYKCFVTGVEDYEYTPGHLPNLEDMDSMIDVLTLCNYCILANVLDFRTYTFANDTDPTPRDRDQRVRWDRNALSQVDREYFIYVRGLAMNFIQWLGCHFDVQLAGSAQVIQSFEKDISGKYLLKQACAIVNYKALAEAEGLLTIPHCKLREVERQLQYLLGDSGDDDTEAWFGVWTVSSLGYRHHTSLAFGEHFTVVRKASPEKFSETPPHTLGLTSGDKKYREGFAKGFPSTKPAKVDTRDEYPESDLEESSGDEFQPNKRKRK